MLIDRPAAAFAASANTAILAMALLLSVPLPAVANADAPPGLAQAVDLAWQRHPQAAGAAARAEAWRAARDMADAITPEPPALSVGNLSDRRGRNRGKEEWEVELAVPLWLPGQKDARSAEAERRRDDGEARRVADKLDVAGEVREAWWSLAAARAAAALANRRLEAARALAAEVDRRHRAGDLARLDANLARAEALNAETEEQAARTDLLRTEQAFRLLAGRSAPAALAEETPVARRDPRGNDGGELHPRLAAAAAAAQAARARLKLAEESRRAAPEVAVRVQRERGEFAEPFANNIGVRLRIPFSSGPRVRQETSVAQAELERAEAEMQRTAWRVELDIERALREIETAERRLAATGERRMLTGDNLRLAEKAFALGESDLATLLRHRGTAFEAAAADDRQRIGRAAAISRLNQAWGALP